MNVLGVLQAVAARIGVPRPGAGVANTDNQVTQMVALLNGLPEDLATRRTEFASTLWVADGTSGELRQYILRDTDIWPALPDAIPVNFLKWKWKAEKGIDYAEDFALYERALGMVVLSKIAKPEIDTAYGGRAYDVHSINQRPWAWRFW